MTSPAIRLENIRKSFYLPHASSRNGQGADARRESAGFGRDAFHVVRDLSLEIPWGQTVGIVGANGSGKTTLLRILAGVMQPDDGTVVINGRVAALLELGAGFHPELTGAENIMLNGAFIGLGRERMRQRIADIIGFAELEHFMDLPIKHYSSGMIVRLGFAIASQLNPDILLLDETFAVGDARFQSRAIQRIRELRAAGATLLLVTHNTDLVLELADRAIWLDQGKIRLDGQPEEVLPVYRRELKVFLAGADRLSAAFGGDAPFSNDTSPVRIESASILSPGELRSEDRLEIQTTLLFPKAVAEGECLLRATFIRDDKYRSAQSVLALDPAGEGEKREIQIAFEPVLLAFGEYSITLEIVEKSRDEVMERYIIRAVFRVVTPLPYDFRLTANLPAEWKQPEAAV